MRYQTQAEVDGWTGVRGQQIGLGTALLQLATAWFARLRDRRQLAELDDRMLRDLGLTRSDIRHEADKPFWQA